MFYLIWWYLIRVVLPHFVKSGSKFSRKKKIGIQTKWKQIGLFWKYRAFILRYFYRFKEQHFQDVKQALQNVLSHVFFKSFFFWKNNYRDHHEMKFCLARWREIEKNLAWWCDSKVAGEASFHCLFWASKC